MSFIKRIGTEEVDFNVEIHIQKLSYNNHNKECLVYFLFQRGDRKVQTRSQILLSNNVAFSGEILELPIRFYYDRQKKLYQEKSGEIYILFQGQKGVKKAGKIKIEFSSYLNSKIFCKKEIIHLQNCTDSQANLQFTIVIGLKNNPEKIQIHHLNFEENTQYQFNSTTSIKLQTKSLKQQNNALMIKKAHIFEYASKSPIASHIFLPDISPILKNKFYSSEIDQSSIKEMLDTNSASDEVHTLKDEVTGLKIQLEEAQNNNLRLQKLVATLKNQQNKVLKPKIMSLLEKNSLQIDNDICQFGNSTQEKLDESISQNVTNIQLQYSYQGSSYIEDTNQQDLLNIQQPQLQLDVETPRFDHQRNILKQIQDEKLLQQVIIELESRFNNLKDQFSDTIQSLKYQLIECKQQIQKDQQCLQVQLDNIMKLGQKYQEVEISFERSKQDSKSFQYQIGSTLKEKDMIIQILEMKVIQSKQTIANAMQEFLIYGDAEVIQIMEFYIN